MRIGVPNRSAPNLCRGTHLRWFSVNSPASEDEPKSRRGRLARLCNIVIPSEARDLGRGAATLRNGRDPLRSG